MLLRSLFPTFSKYPWNAVVGAVIVVTVALSWLALLMLAAPSSTQARLFLCEYGRWMRHDDNGRVVLLERPGERDGETIHTIVFEDGWRADSVTVAGVLQDERRVYDASGRLRVSERLSNGKLTGPCSAWDEQGRLRVHYEPGPTWWPWTRNCCVWDEKHERYVFLRQPWNGPS